MENRRTFIGRALLGVAAVWASLAIVFVVTGGGDAESVQVFMSLGVMASVAQVSGEWDRFDAAKCLALGIRQAPRRSFRRLAVLAAVGGALLAATVLIFTPRGLADWAFGAACWAAGFAGLAFADTLGWRRSRRRLHQEPPSPGSIGYPSR